MFFVRFAKPLQDLHCFFHGGFFHIHRLESPLQSRILLNVFPVLFDRCRTDELDLSPCQGRLQDIGRIHGSLCSASPNDRMKLINEKKDILAFFRLFDDAFDPLLKLSPVFASGYHTGHIKCQKSPVL